MSKLRRSAIPALLVAASWLYEIRNYQPPQPPDPTTATDDMSVD